MNMQGGCASRYNIKRLIILLVLFSGAEQKVVAQNTATTDFLVLITGDTLYGDVEHIHEKGVHPYFYKKIRLTMASGKRKKFKSALVASFKNDGSVYESFWLSQSADMSTLFSSRYNIDPINGKQHFLKVITKGKLSHYHLEWFEQGDAALNYMDLVKKEEQSYFLRATQGIFGIKSKLLLSYFSNCPDLRQKIEGKQFKKVEQIVDFYNHHCAF
ncbi:MAG: hypothetical protein R3279_03260 [Putridiphycobacter sp.]|nr:hypothetical protein [Putridiphycobacter sp.]